jgi:hypothetical protein
VLRAGKQDHQEKFMRPSAHIIITAAAVALTAGAASAQEKQSITRAEQSASAEARFKRLDADGNGRFDKAEYLKVRAQAEREAQAKLRQLLTAEFAELDGNKDQGLTEAEIDAKVQAGAGKSVLARLDGNKDKKISSAEYTGQAAKLQSAVAADEQMTMWDANGDKTVTKAEYLGAALARFDRLDGDKNGTVTAAEAAAAAKSSSAVSMQGR